MKTNQMRRVIPVHPKVVERWGKERVEIVRKMIWRIESQGGTVGLGEVLRDYLKFGIDSPSEQAGDGGVEQGEVVTVDKRTNICIGESVYASYDGERIWLAVHDPRNKVLVIDQDILKALNEYAEGIWHRS